MQKAINIDNTQPICRILSIADISATEISPNGLTYIPVEYVEKPHTSGKQIAYPMYNTETEEMYWSVVEYQATITDMMLNNINTEARLATLESNIQDNQTLIDELEGVINE